MEDTVTPSPLSSPGGRERQHMGEPGGPHWSNRNVLSAHHRWVLTMTTLCVWALAVGGGPVACHGYGDRQTLRRDENAPPPRRRPIPARTRPDYTPPRPREERAVPTGQDRNSGGRSAAPLRRGSMGGPDNLSDLVERLMPAVVNIATSEAVRFNNPNQAPEQDQGHGQGPGSPADDPNQEPPEGERSPDFFRRFFERDEPDLRRRSLGSGVIIDEEGYVVTNSHVVERADRITINLGDEASYPAEVVGTDPLTDLALLRFKPDRPVRAAPWGDSDELRVGDWVMAIGNPFGLGRTVTAGIVSAKGRVIGAGPYDDFIQTDTAINPGNSGGPIFNMSGEMIGIATAMISIGQGIGFAVPSALARPILDTIRSEGEVVRGWLGVIVQRVSPELAETFDMERPEGALVTRVPPGTPADQGGLEVGDVILEFNDQPVDNVDNLPTLVARHRPGDKVIMIVLRDGEKKKITLVLGRRPEGH